MGVWLKLVSPVTVAIQMPLPSRFELFPVLLVKVKLMLSPTMFPECFLRRSDRKLRAQGHLIFNAGRNSCAGRK